MRRETVRLDIRSPFAVSHSAACAVVNSCLPGRSVNAPSLLPCDAVGSSYTRGHICQLYPPPQPLCPPGGIGPRDAYPIGRLGRNVPTTGLTPARPRSWASFVAYTGYAFGSIMAASNEGEK